MANVANTKATGPVSKDAVSGGKTFPLKHADGPKPRGHGTPLTNSKDGEHTKIKGMRVKSTGFEESFPDKSSFMKHRIHN